MRLAWVPVFMCSAIASGCYFDNSVLAQSIQPSDVIPPAPVPKLPEVPPQVLPPADELLKPSNPQTTPTPEIPNTGDTFVVQEFRVVGSTVFSFEELAAAIKSFANRPITFAELLQARAAISDLYIRNGYITSGAFIPPQETNNGTITIQVVEGKLEDIQITGTDRLDPG
jgi:hemolysin activation/secretion protein